MINQNLPTFLIIGAAKSGTTSLHLYLKQHPEIYMSQQKELNFFALENQSITFKGPGDISGIHSTSITNLDDYLAHFSNIGSEQVYGETSPLYLYSKSAPKNIKKHIPNIKMIVVLRNPVERAYSAYNHLKRDNREKEKFINALALEKVRINSNWAEIWHYVNMGLYYKQLKRFYSIFSKNQIKVILYNDFVNNPEVILKKILKFIGINSNYKFNLKRKYNISGLPKNKLLHQLLIRNNLLKSIVKIAIPQKIRYNLREKIINLNLKSIDELTYQNKKQVYKFFKDDINDLEKLIKIDLTSWKYK